MSDLTLDIDVTNAAGEATGLTVPVVVEYVLIPYEYGTDADGRQGEMRYEREILDAWINPQQFLPLNMAQIEQVLLEARTQFAERSWR